MLFGPLCILRHHRDFLLNTPKRKGKEKSLVTFYWTCDFVLLLWQGRRKKCFIVFNSVLSRVSVTLHHEQHTTPNQSQTVIDFLIYNKVVHTSPPVPSPLSTTPLLPALWMVAEVASALHPSPERGEGSPCRCRWPAGCPLCGRSGAPRCPGPDSFSSRAVTSYLSQHATPPLINPGHHPAKPRPCYTSSPYRHPVCACAGWRSGWGGPWAVRACYGRPGGSGEPGSGSEPLADWHGALFHTGCMQAHVGHAEFFFPFGWLTQGMLEFWTMEPFCSLKSLILFK